MKGTVKWFNNKKVTVLFLMSPETMFSYTTQD